MKLLDLFCGAGGAAMGYYQAGFTDITGVDIKLQKRYPFKFIQGDAFEYLEKNWCEYDIVVASPRCQKFSKLAACRPNNIYPDQITPLREILIQIKKPYVIENVEGAPLINPIMLCGSMFGLKVLRHRLFECNPVIWFPPMACAHDTGGIPKAGTRGLKAISSKGFISVAGNFSNVNYVQFAMDINWMTRDELAQAIPPAYTKWIGEQLLKVLST